MFATCSQAWKLLFKHLECEEEANFSANLESFEFLGSAGNLNWLVGSQTDILNSKFMTLDAASF